MFYVVFGAGTCRITDWDNTRDWRTMHVNDIIYVLVLLH